MRENALEAMAIVAMAAYPLWRPAGKIPAPLLMIGAGVALARRSGKGDDCYMNDPESNTGAYTGAAAESDGQGPLASARETVSNIGSQISEKAHDTMGWVRNFASEKESDASDLLSQTYRDGRGTAANSLQRTSETYGRTRDTLADVIVRHPVMARGTAFAVGTLLAVSLPVMRHENRMMDSANDDIKRQAQDLASEDLHEAEAQARDVYRSAADRVREEGLTPEGTREASRAAMETAYDAIEPSSSKTTRPARSNA